MLTALSCWEMQLVRQKQAMISKFLLNTPKVNGLVSDFFSKKNVLRE